MNQLWLICALLVAFHLQSIRGGTYYFAPNGTDPTDRCTGGTLANPWRSWRANRSCFWTVPGTTLYFLPGDYPTGAAAGIWDYSDWNSIEIWGNATHYMTIAAYNKPANSWNVRFLGNFYMRGKYINLRGIEISGDTAITGKDVLSTSTSFMTIEDCYIHGQPSNYLGPGVNSSTLSKQGDCIRIGHYQYYDYGDDTVVRTLDFTLKNSQVAYCGEDCIDSTGTKGVYYYNNDFHHCHILQIKGGTENLIADGNRIWNTTNGFYGAGMDCTTYCGNPDLPSILPPTARFGAKNVTITNNLIQPGGWKNVKIYHNTVYASGGSFIRVQRAGLKFFDAPAINYCHNGGELCTINGTNAVTIQFYSEDISVRNNIVLIHDNPIYVIEQGSLPGFRASNNLFNWTVASSKFNFINPSKSHRTLAELNANDGGPFETNSLENVSPQFVDSARGDFKLRSTSPAINAGASVGVTRDYFGTVRGNPPDIGFSEYVPPPTTTTSTSTSTSTSSRSTTTSTTSTSTSTSTSSRSTTSTSTSSRTTTSSTSSSTSTSTTGPVSVCRKTTTTWQPFPLAEQTSPFNVYFTASATTQTTNAGFFLSDGPVVAHANGSVCVRFNEDPDIDAYHTSDYTADVVFTYEANRTYYFHISVDLPNQVFDLLVGSQWDQMVRVASGYPFRRSANRLNHWNIIHHNTNTAAGEMTVCDVSLIHPNPTTTGASGASSSSTSTTGALSTTALPGSTASTTADPTTEDTEISSATAVGASVWLFLLLALYF